MKWHEIRIYTTGEASEAIQELLNSLGAKGCEITEPDQNLENSYGCICTKTDIMKIPTKAEDCIIIRAWFSSLDNNNINQQEISSKVREGLKNISRYLDIGAGKIETSEVHDENWANNWKKYYKTFMISERFLIKPSWEQCPRINSGADINNGNEIFVIDMDPGMAFGSGTHETTALCAVYLDEIFRSHGNLAVRNAAGNNEIVVVDAGCGSGILTIIAVLAGADRVVAFDTDPVAVKTTTENCERNKTINKTEILHGDIKCLQGKNIKADIFVANIITDIILQIIPEVQNYIKDNGSFIASGIIQSRYDEVVDAAAVSGFKIVSEKRKGEWVAFELRKNGIEANRLNE